MSGYIELKKDYILERSLLHHEGLTDVSMPTIEIATSTRTCNCN